LQTVISVISKKGMTFHVTEYGESFKGTAMGNGMRGYARKSIIENKG